MSLQSDAFGDLDRELATTRRFLERVPEEHLQWRPHEKSFNLARMAGHLANLPTWQMMTLTTDGFDIGQEFVPEPEPESTADILAKFDKNAAALTALMEGLDDDVLREEWSFRNGDTVIWSESKLNVFRIWGINHLVHHRAQLGVYFRLLDIPVPGAYGPSADENPIE